MSGSETQRKGEVLGKYDPYTGNLVWKDEQPTLSGEQDVSKEPRRDLYAVVVFQRGNHLISFAVGNEVTRARDVFRKLRDDTRDSKSPFFTLSLILTKKGVQIDSYYSPEDQACEIRKLPFDEDITAEPEIGRNKGRGFSPNEPLPTPHITSDYVVHLIDRNNNRMFRGSFFTESEALDRYGEEKRHLPNGFVVQILKDNRSIHQFPR